MPHVGTIACPAPGCGKTAAVSHSANGVRNIKCPHCAFSGYGPAGSRAARLIDQQTVRAEPDEAAPPARAATPPAANPPARTPAPPAAPARKPGGLLIGG